jgi:hypothetical protein
MTGTGSRPGERRGGRRAGTRNKRTQQFLALAGHGESPVEFGLSIMRDSTKDLTVRLHAARIVAPYLHPRPAPSGEIITCELPEAATLQNVTEAVAAILKQVSQGKMSVTTGRDLVSIIDVQRKSIELVEIEKRIEALERVRGN